MTASDEKRDAHQRCLRWSHVLTGQIGRLHEARYAAVASQQTVLAKGRYDVNDAHAFFMMDAEAHFALVAARQLLRSLRAFDGSDRLPGHLEHSKLRLVRDALEHWDEPDGRAARGMQKLGADRGLTVGHPAVPDCWAISLLTPRSKSGRRTSMTIWSTGTPGGTGSQPRLLSRRKREVTHSSRL